MNRPPNDSVTSETVHLGASRPPPPEVADELRATHAGSAELQALAERVEVGQRVAAVDPLGSQTALTPPLDQLGQRAVAVDVAHRVAAPDAEARKVSRGRVVVELYHGETNLPAGHPGRKPGRRRRITIKKVAP